MQFEFKIFKDEVKVYFEFSGSLEDVKVWKVVMVVVVGVVNQSKKWKKVVGMVVFVGNGVGQGFDGLDMIYEFVSFFVFFVICLNINVVIIYS